MNSESKFMESDKRRVTLKGAADFHTSSGAGGQRTWAETMGLTHCPAVCILESNLSTLTFFFYNLFYFSFLDAILLLGKMTQSPITN